jgi:hypothetical protein
MPPHPFIVQSYVENKPPQTPKFPPNTGALAFIAVSAPILLSPYGLVVVSSEAQRPGLLLPVSAMER